MAAYSSAPREREGEEEGEARDSAGGLYVCLFTSNRISLRKHKAEVNMIVVFLCGAAQLGFRKEVLNNCLRVFQL